MPIGINHLKNNTRTIDIHYMGEVGQVTYRPSELTGAVLAEIREASEGEEFYNSTAELLVRLLISWDVMDSADPPKPLPITYDVLQELPSNFLTTISDACQEDMFSKKKNGRR